MMNKTGMTRKSTLLIKAFSAMDGGHWIFGEKSTLSIESFCPTFSADVLEELSSGDAIEGQYVRSPALGQDLLTFATHCGCKTKL